MEEVKDPHLVEVEEKLKFLYVHNNDISAFLEYNDLEILLHEYHCYCYGNKNGVRTLFSLRIHGVYKMKSRIHYFVSIPGITEGPVWVSNALCLRRNFFTFEDKTSFFRSTFLYDPWTKDIYRLHRLIPYLRCLQISPENEKIYESPLIWSRKNYPSYCRKCYCFASIDKKQKMLQKKWKEFLHQISIETQSCKSRENIAYAKTWIEQYGHL